MFILCNSGMEKFIYGMENVMDWCVECAGCVEFFDDVGRDWLVF